MKYSVAASSLLAAGALASPLATRQSTNIDPTILQFALTLEHLENVFYHNALKNFTLQDFQKAGYSATYYNNLKYISYDEQSHVQLLSSALTAAGYTPVQACQYNFPYTDVKSFITLSSVLEGVGTSAYLAGAPLITSKQYLTVAGSILVAEALHTSMQRGAIGEVPMANPYGTPLDPTSVYTLAANFIVSCPAGNAPLPFKPFPALSYAPNPACYCEGPECLSPKASKRSDADWGVWNGDSSSSSAEGSKTMSAEGSKTSSVEGYSMTKSSAAESKTTAMSESKSMGMSEGEYKTKTVTEHETKTGSAVMSTVTVYNGNNNGYMGNAPSPNNCAPPSAGASIMLTAASDIPAGSYVTFVSGLAVVSVPGTISGKTITAVIPSVAAGQTYVFVSKSDVEGTLDDSAVLFGPAIVEVNPAPPAIDYSIN